MTVDGTPRTAAVHVPTSEEIDGTTEPLPVVLSFHGVNGSPAVQQATDGLLAWLAAWHSVERFCINRAC